MWLMGGRDGVLEVCTGNFWIYLHIKLFRSWIKRSEFCILFRAWPQISISLLDQTREGFFIFTSGQVKMATFAGQAQAWKFWPVQTSIVCSFCILLNFYREKNWSGPNFVSCFGLDTEFRFLFQARPGKKILSLLWAEPRWQPLQAGSGPKKSGLCRPL